ELPAEPGDRQVDPQLHLDVGGSTHRVRRSGCGVNEVLGQIGVGAGDDVHGNDLADRRCRLGTGLGGRPYRARIAPDDAPHSPPRPRATLLTLAPLPRPRAAPSAAT